jgi:hypothetical protein
MNDFLHSLRNGQADKPRAPKTRKNYDNSYQYSSNPRFHSYGSSGYQNPRNPNMKRQPLPPGPMGNQLPPEDPGITLLADAIENLTHHVEILVKNQEYLTSVQERTADMMERQAYAIERIVSHLRLESGPRHEAQSEPAPCFESRQPTGEIREPALEDRQDPMDTQPQVDEIHFSEDTGGPSADAAPAPHGRVIRKRRKTAAEKKQPLAAAPGTPLLARDEVMNIIQTMREQGATYDQIARHLVDLGQPTFSGRGEWHAQTIHRLCGRK